MRVRPTKAIVLSGGQSVKPYGHNDATDADNPHVNRSEAGSVETLGTRIFLAHKVLESRLGHNVSFEEYGKMIAREEKRTDRRGKPWPYSAGNVLRWEKGEKRPSLEAIEAIAKLARMRAGFVAFGELPQYSANSGPGGGAVRELPPESLQPIAPERKRESRGVMPAVPANRPVRRGR